MSFSHRKKAKVISHPIINYIWIGPPSGSDGVISGHDIAGPIHMAQVNQSNKIIFWCLEEYKDHYRMQFSDHSIEVVGIQSFLTRDFEDPTLNQTAEQLRHIGRETLGWGKNTQDFNRGAVRDRVSFKNVFSLFLLALGGSTPDAELDLGGVYTLDTNVRPKAGISALILPDYNEFKIPRLPKQIECWMLYAPSNNDRAKAVLNYYLQQWHIAEDIFQQEGGYTETYYRYMGGLMLNALSSIKHMPCEYWHLSLEKEGVIMIDLLNLEKRYYNTHKFENRSEHENKKFLVKNNFMLFVAHGNLPSVFADNIKTIIFDYTYEQENCLIQELSRNIADKGSKPGEVFFAIQQNDVSRLQELLKYGHDINQKITYDEYKNVTPLHFAIMYNKVESLIFLLDNNADPNQVMFYINKPFTTFELASTKPQCKAILEEYLKKIADLRSSI